MEETQNFVLKRRGFMDTDDAEGTQLFKEVSQQLEKPTLVGNLDDSCCAVRSKRPQQGDCVFQHDEKDCFVLICMQVLQLSTSRIANGTMPAS